MYPTLLAVCTVKLASLTLYVNCEFVTESTSVAVTINVCSAYMYQLSSTYQ